jgi:hypothetical protein
MCLCLNGIKQSFVVESHLTVSGDITKSFNFDGNGNASFGLLILGNKGYLKMTNEEAYDSFKFSLQEIENDNDEEIGYGRFNEIYRSEIVDYRGSDLCSNRDNKTDSCLGKAAEVGGALYSRTCDTLYRALLYHHSQTVVFGEHDIFVFNPVGFCCGTECARL